MMLIDTVMPWALYIAFTLSFTASYHFAHKARMAQAELLGNLALYIGWIIVTLTFVRTLPQLF